ncbi:MAG: Rrf2 family transcriptional regulator [Clostridiales bacterium]|nr:Rrf2 family transcriptional regulator [Clostridiales bacterium]
MKISTRGRYGLRAMVDLALHYEKGYIPLKTIAGRQEISEGYLEQLFAILRKENLIDSVRGAQGGYRLSDSPENIEVGKILRALEGPIVPVECAANRGDPKCQRYSNCSTRSLWEKMRHSIEEVVDSVSLKDLILDNTSNDKS